MAEHGYDGRNIRLANAEWRAKRAKMHPAHRAVLDAIPYLIGIALWALYLAPLWVPFVKGH